MAARLTAITASVGSIRRGSGTSTMRTSPAWNRTAARIVLTSSVSLWCTQLLPLAVVFGVGDLLAPVRLRSLTLRHAFGHGEVRHDVVGCSAVPVPFVRGCEDDVPGPDADDVAPARLHKPRALGDVQGLAERVGVPGGACARREVNGADADARGFLALGDGVEPHIPGEPLCGTFGGRLLGLDLHGVSFVL